MSQFPGPDGQLPDQPNGYGAPPPAYQDSVNTPVGTAVPTMVTRLLARLIDWVIVGVPFLIVYVVAIVGMARTTTVDPVTGQVTSANAGQVAVIGALLGLLGLLGLLYEVVLIALRGATIGKSVMKIKVVREDTGAVPGWGPSIVRWLVPYVGTFVCGIGECVVYLSPYFDKSGRQQGWHDKAAHTQVVNAG